MRTQQEIADKIVSLESTDIFGFKTRDLMVYLDYEHAKPYLKEHVTAESWAESQVKPDAAALLKEMKEYMAFAWDKANNCRGLSAARSMDHFEAWTWLLGDDDKFKFYGWEHYGKDVLVAICNHYGWDSKQWDDGVRVNNDRGE